MIAEEIEQRTEQMLNLWVNVAHCARCGGHHKNLMFKRFEGEIPEPWSYWALCPQTKAPILLKVEHTPEGVALVEGADGD